MSKRILYIEDNLVNLQLIRRMLKATNCELLEATNGIDGLREAEAQQPDLILLDINMPDTDGYDVIHELKRDPILHHIPVIALTADSTNYHKCIEAGFDGYLNKPITTLTLMQTILQYMN